MSRQTLDPKLDIVFKMLFGAPENHELLLSLLSAAMSPASPIRSAQVIASEAPREDVDVKGIVLDLRVELENGEQVDVEMQSQPRRAQRDRALYYWARLYSTQLKRGERYTDLRRAVVLQILNFSELEGSRFHSTFRVREIHSGQELSNHLEVHLVELTKLQAAASKNDEPALIGWGKFLSASSDEELEALAMSDPVFRQAKSALQRLSADAEARIAAEQRELALDSYNIEFSRARSEGENKGRADLLMRQLTLKFGPLPAAVSARINGATESDLLRWGERLISAESLDAVFKG